MHARVMSRLKTKARRIYNRWRPGVIVLMYHRVADIRQDPGRISVPPARFSEHMEVVRRYAHPIAASDVARAAAEHRLPRRGVAVTFDDGYVDNLANAKPVLERFDIPATVFVASGYCGQRREFWWEELRRLLLEPGRLPRTISLSPREGGLAWDLGRSENYSLEDWDRCRLWEQGESNDPTARHGLCRRLYAILQVAHPAERRALLDQVAAWAGVGVACREENRPMTPEELLTLTADGLVQVGSHTVSHSCLAALSQPEQRQELRESKAQLEAIVGHAVDTFSYPFGFPSSHYTEDTVREVADAGYAVAFAGFLGVVRRGSDRLQLPRAVVRNWDGDEFARHLEEWIAR